MASVASWIWLNPGGLAVFCCFSLIALLGGFRGEPFIMMVMTFALLFYLHAVLTWLFLPMIFMLLAAGGRP